MNENNSFSTRWRSYQALAAPLTELLLWFEDRLTAGSPTFMKCEGFKDHLSKHRHHADLVLFVNQISAAVASINKAHRITAIDENSLLTYLLELGRENGANVMFLTSGRGKLSRIIEERRRQDRSLRYVKLDSRDTQPDELEFDVFDHHIELIFSEWDDQKAWKSYKRITKALQKDVVWIQVSNTRVKHRFQTKQRHAQVSASTLKQLQPGQ